ncbi:MAG: cytochrome c-type biogenesis protein CcmH, partial [Gammaproteobacteria bacterium]|nr:cytochrome c-type biogenesis protein CcmH [Gammaproteobacteria bacterium]
KRFHLLMEELRCPKCQNQNLEDSNAGLARDLKTRAYDLLKEGKSNQDIVDYMVERYGDFVTYRPPLRPTTWLLWFGPFVILLLAGFLLLWRTWRVSKEVPEKTELDRERLKQVLQQYEDDEPE